MLEDDAIADCLLNRVEKDNGGNITDAVWRPIQAAKGHPWLWHQ